MRTPILLGVIWSLVALTFAGQSFAPSFESGGYGQGEKYSAKDYLNKNFDEYRKNSFDGSGFSGHRNHGDQSLYGGGLQRHHNNFGGQGGYDEHYYNRGSYKRNTGSGYEKAWGWDRIKIIKDVGDKKHKFGAQHGQQQGLKKKEYGGQSNFGQESQGHQGYRGGNDQEHGGKVNFEHQKGGENTAKGYRLRQRPFSYGAESHQGQGFGLGGQSQGFGLGSQSQGSQGFEGQAQGLQRSRLNVAPEQNQGRYQDLDQDDNSFVNSEPRGQRVKYNRKRLSPLNNYEPRHGIGEETSESLTGSEYEKRLKFKREPAPEIKMETKSDGEDYASNLKYKRVDTTMESKDENSERRQDEPEETKTENEPKALSIRRSRRPLSRKLTITTRRRLYGTDNGVLKRYHSGLPGFGEKLKRLLKFNNNALSTNNEENFFKRGGGKRKKYHSGLDGFGEAAVVKMVGSTTREVQDVPITREALRASEIRPEIFVQSEPITVGNGNERSGSGSSVSFPSTGNRVRG